MAKGLQMTIEELKAIKYETVTVLNAAIAAVCEQFNEKTGFEITHIDVDIGCIDGEETAAELADFTPRMIGDNRFIDADISHDISI